MRDARCTTFRRSGESHGHLGSMAETTREQLVVEMFEAERVPLQRREHFQAC